MRIPLAPAGERAGGWISAGMISTVQTPLPIFAETEPKIWAHFWAPSPGADTISTVWSFCWVTFFFLDGALSLGSFFWGFCFFCRHFCFYVRFFILLLQMRRLKPLSSFVANVSSLG